AAAAAPARAGTARRDAARPRRAGHRPRRRDVRARVAGRHPRPRPRRRRGPAAPGRRGGAGHRGLEAGGDVHRASGPVPPQAGPQRHRQPSGVALDAGERRSAMIPSILWKEYREQRSIWLTLALLAAGVLVGVPTAFPIDESQSWIRVQTYKDTLAAIA